MRASRKQKADMSHIKLNQVGNEFRSIKARVVAVRELAVEITGAVVEQYLPQDPRRRAVLKYGALGGAAFVLAKVLGPSLQNLPSLPMLPMPVPPPVVVEANPVIVQKEFLFKDFRVVEEDGKLSFYDKSGNEILVLDNEGGDPEPEAQA